MESIDNHKYISSNKEIYKKGYEFGEQLYHARALELGKQQTVAKQDELVFQTMQDIVYYDQDGKLYEKVLDVPGVLHLENRVEERRNERVLQANHVQRDFHNE
jgi:hypothetical protein